MEYILYRLSGRVVILLVLAICLLCCQGTSPAKEQSAAKTPDRDFQLSAENQEEMSEMFKGTVVEVIDTGRHIFLQIDTGKTRVWVAVPAFDGKVGDMVIVPPAIPSANFHSKTLNRDFEMMYFVGGVRRVDEMMTE